MDRDDLVRAARANDELETAERRLQELLSGDFQVVGITVQRRDGGQPISLEKGRSGTGSISSIGYGDDLRSLMTKSLYCYFRQEIETARGKLASLGVNVAA